MMTKFIFLLFISCASCNNDIDEKCLEDDTCRTLNDEVFKYIDHSVDPCDDILSYSCKGYDKFLHKKSLRYRLTEMKEYLENLLSSPVKEEDNEMLKVEKTLYESCLRLADSRWHDHVRDLKLHLNNLIKSTSNWIKIETKLFSLGFGFSFFDMKVIPHPEFESKISIMLLPPPLENLKNLDKILHKIMEYKEEYKRNPLSSVAQDVENHYQFMNETTTEGVQRFFDKLMQAKLGLSSETTDDTMNYYTSLEDFQKTAKSSIIRNILSKEHIKIDTDRIILKNPEYFKRLTRLLYHAPEDIIASAVLTKAVTESLPYVNWLTANLLGPIDRREFCLKETKLYGASHKLVHDWLIKFPNEDISRIISMNKGEPILENIMSVIRDEIELYSTEWPSKAMFYSRKLLHVTDHLTHFVYEVPYNLYEDLNISSHSYWKNILEYRKFWAKSELQKLKQFVDVIRPFSFIDQDESQNRYIIATLVNIADMRSPDTPKEVHYGTFGVRTARLITSLLHEDTYNVDHDVMKAITKSFTYPKYTKQMASCIGTPIIKLLEFGNSVIPFVETITNILALNTVQIALRRVEPVAPHDLSNTFLSHHKINQTKLFLFSYVQDNCGFDGDMINQILHYNPPLNEAFVQCNQTISHIYGTTCILGTLNY